MRGFLDILLGPKPDPIFDIQVSGETSVFDLGKVSSYLGLESRWQKIDFERNKILAVVDARQLRNLKRWLRAHKEWNQYVRLDVSRRKESAGAPPEGGAQSQAAAGDALPLRGVPGLGLPESAEASSPQGGA